MACKPAICRSYRFDFFAYKYLNINSIFAFWTAYILTRPLGASVGDLLSQDVKDGGLGLGTTLTSIVFLLTILGLVIYITVRNRKLPEGERAY